MIMLSARPNPQESKLFWGGLGIGKCPLLVDNKISITIKYSRLSHDVVSCEVDRDVSTAYCKASSGDKVNWLRVIF